MDERIINHIVEAVLRELGAEGEGAPPADSLVTPDIAAGRVVIGVSARHIHLTPEHVGVLFGPGSRLTSLKPLIQPGEFASEQQVTLVGPSGRTIGPVRVLGPERAASQVEMSLTDCHALRLPVLPPIRPSGNHADSVGLTLVGPAGAVTLTSGVIRANRHVHLHTAQAAAMGLKDRDVVSVRVAGERPAVLEGVQVRASDNFRAEFHLDTDDANAIGVRSGDVAQILLPRGTGG